MTESAETWTKGDWERLRRLQAGFWQGGVPVAWQDERDVELYAAVFGERIVWKWAAVLQILDAQGWRPQSRQVFDWGCGTGGPSRLVAAWADMEAVFLHDASSLVRQWAERQHRAEGRQVRPGAPSADGGPFLLLLSHVLAELGEKGLAELRRWMMAAQDILWVEPGDRRTSRALGGMRAELLAGGFRVVAPCPQAGVCPALSPGQEQEWCHFFGRPPGWIFQSAHWREIARRLEIDLRALPYSFLVLSKKAEAVWDGAHRLLGRAEVRKGEVGQQACGDGELVRLRWQKREHPALYRALKHHPEELSGRRATEAAAFSSDHPTDRSHPSE